MDKGSHSWRLEAQGTCCQQGCLAGLHLFWNLPSYPAPEGQWGIALWVCGALLLRAGVWAVVGTERTWALGPTGTWMTSGGRGGLSRMPLVSRDAESCFSAQSWGFGSGKCVSHGEGPSAGLRGYFSYLLIVLGIPPPPPPRLYPECLGQWATSPRGSPLHSGNLTKYVGAETSGLTLFVEFWEVVFRIGSISWWDGTVRP